METHFKNENFYWFCLSFLFTPKAGGEYDISTYITTVDSVVWTFVNADIAIGKSKLKLETPNFVWNKKEVIFHKTKRKQKIKDCYELCSWICCK